MDSSKPRILFVDDEANILQGIRRMLRKMRKEWDMSFAEGGEAALAALKKDPFHVVVSDMRMPGMDGGELLRRVQKEYPSSIRIILSGFSEQEGIMRSVGPAHQFLAKPCDSQVLVETINRALTLRGFIRSDDLLSLLGGINCLPTPPETFSAMMAELESPNASAATLADVIKDDVAITAELLKLTNSAYFGISSNVDSVLQAVRLLGFETIQALALVTGVFQSFRGNENSAERLRKLCERSVSIGALAKKICEAEGASAKCINQAACAGVVAHVGSLVLGTHWGKNFADACAEADGKNLTMIESERAAFGATHPKIGAYLLGLWGFKDPVIEAVAYHHEPSSCTHQEFSPLTAVHAAQYLCRLENEELSLDTSLKDTFDMDYLAKVGVQDRIEVWRELVSKKGAA
jgi:HD-like signal output (HDOD) protein/CheY-like chemotaxis protein